MPSKLRAGGVFPYILLEDRATETVPQFELRILSGEDTDEVASLRKQFIEGQDKQASFLKLIEKTVAKCVIPGMEGQSIRSVLTDRECWELIAAAITGAALTSEERKKYVSPPKSAMDSCVGDVVAEFAKTE